MRAELPITAKIPAQCHFEDVKVGPPISFKIVDLFGAHIQRSAKNLDELNKMEFTDGIVKMPYANPLYIETIPRLCPRAKIIQRGSQKSLAQLGPAQLGLVYDAANDFLNDKPTVQIFDSDYMRLPMQHNIWKNFDDKNVLRITRVKITYDYEDTAILDYQGPHPITKKPHLVYVGEGGFYANFHYAVLPFDARYLQLKRQELLNLAQGKLHLIHRDDLVPKFRVHSFIPGPYLSKDQVYQFCEWGDTSFQAKKQEMSYENFKIWDWDLGPQKVIIVVWEGDEEDWLIQEKLLDPFYLTDDLVATFVVNRADVLKPKILKNGIGNFEMEIVTK